MRTAFPPLRVTWCPLVSMVVSAPMTSVLVSVIVPSQANVTVPPSARAARKLGSSQLFTVAASPTELKPSNTENSTEKSLNLT